MAAKPRKTVTRKTRPQPPAGGNPPAERPKDVKKSFGKAAPRQVMNTASASQKGRRATDQSIAARALGGLGRAVRSITSLFGKSETQPKAKR